ncbi:MAG: AAA family ATPase [Gammaproteobacteria bacterium]|nr:AAA family ATPase [Gammaproteobacteria bacterium]
MKLVKLTLDSWRGVDHCDIGFSNEVTLIEGPNEVGKSTIVEAVYTLFKEMDSSTKQAIKSIQPVGQDVGSRVEAEVITGPYHFVYEKTYNKGKQTALRILEPAGEQLTGREAHERAEQILDETIDRVLWSALLVEQGKEITRADLSNSTGLARALDAAAGTAAEASDDSALISAIQAEYEQYFTLKTGKPRFAQLEDEVRRQREQVAATEAALVEVEDDSATLERMQKEVRRLQGAMPGLKSSVAEQEAAWKEVEALKETVNAKKAELVSARGDS